MQYVVCYDITSDAEGDRRRSRVASALLNFGGRVQESVFVANLDHELAVKMMNEVRRFVDARQDRVHVFELCASCAARTKTVGEAEVPEDRDFYVI
jgi:CRISPR-associated protein Cas2